MDTLETAVLSRAPLVYVTSPDESRVVTRIQNLSHRTGRRLWMYAATRGLWDVYCAAEGPEPRFEHGAANNGLRDPLELLAYLQEMHVPACGIIFLLLDFQQWLRDPLIQRHLRDMRQTLQGNKSTIVLLAPVRVQVPELEHDFRYLDYPRPSAEELVQHLEFLALPVQSPHLRLHLQQPYVKEELAAAAGGLTLYQFEQCLSGALTQTPDTADAADLVAALQKEKKQLIGQSGLLEVLEGLPATEVGGLSAVKDWFHKRRHGFSAAARAAGLPQPRGVLLFGVPGAGKSLAAKAVSGLWQFPLLRLDTGRLFTSQVGGSEERVRQALETVEAAAPCILWIDELDKAMAGLGSSSDSDAGTAARVFASLATWMQEKSAPVFIMATANSVLALPPELLRKGRWDEIFFVDLPGLGDRREIIAIHLAKRGSQMDEADIRLLAEHSRGYSGAEIEQAIINGLYEAFAEDRPLTAEDVLAGLAEQVPLSVAMQEEIAELRQWAAGRARPASTDALENQRENWRRQNVKPLATVGTT